MNFFHHLFEALVSKGFCFLQKKRNQEILASPEEEGKLRRGRREGAFEIIIREVEEYQQDVKYIDGLI